jgi:AraC family transcriptional regulator of adaptative response / DNA-3-methyladenine glycosylase II
VTSRHLRRLFSKHLGASPLAVAHTQRLHFAKRLIDETTLPMSHISSAAGYGSVRRFNDTFRRTYGRTPRELRKAGEESERTATLTVRLAYRQPFNWQAMLSFFAGRATPGVEVVEGNTYRRTVSLQGDHGVVEIRPDARDGYLSLTLHSINTNALFETVQTAREVFDLDAPVTEINATLSNDKTLRKIQRRNKGVRVPGAWDGFELTVRAILGQQISVKAATTLAGRIAARYGEKLQLTGDSDEAELSRIFPPAERLARARFNNLGVLQSRVDTIRRVAGAVVSGDLHFDVAQDPDEFCTTLKSIRGIGDWTAQYVAMRALKTPDAFPGSDLGLVKAIEHPERVTPKELLTRAENWRPWRAYAAMLLWSSLSNSGG